MGSKKWRILHVTLTTIWLLLIIPTILWWKESVLWVAFCSLYANSAMHMFALADARKEKKMEEKS